MVSELDSGLRGPGSTPGCVVLLCSWARHFTLTVSLSTQEYKQVPANCQGNLTKCWGITCDELTSHPGGVAIFLVTSCYERWYKLRLCGPLGSCADFTFFTLVVNRLTINSAQEEWKRRKWSNCSPSLPPSLNF